MISVKKFHDTCYYKMIRQTLFRGNIKVGVEITGRGFGREGMRWGSTLNTTKKSENL